MATVAVVGAGDIGGACAQALAARDRIGHILVIDAAVNAAAGKALDIQQAGAICGFHTRLVATAERRSLGHPPKHPTAPASWRGSYLPWK